ncbi:MAG: bifunctional oligoribonuclease/PAP phosphatase NrnA [Oscillospiraceae bacterium]|nr:bifunctional oligoribonuclease/PAP phosphatase NrnA [Oscillospiraceae bacterium]
MFEKILELIRRYDRIIIHRHNRPDGDAMGSQIGLKHIILENFPGKQVYTVGDEAKRFAFMADSVMDQIPDEAYNGALAIILDTSAKALISDDRYTLAEITARIDHHIFCEKIADVEVTDTSFESCCGMITQFAVECGLKLNQTASNSLYTGMVTDSGRFRYDATTSRTFYLASKLMEQPCDTNALYGNLYADDFVKVQLRAKFVLKINFTAGNVAYIYTDLAEAKALNVETFTISREMVNTMANIRGVDIWVNFTETEDGVLCEIRSSKYNINPVAVKYGGGGHAKASGATVADRKTAMAMLNDLDAMAGGNV